jgi:hypothetical protein
MQLSLIPDLVAHDATQKTATNSRQLSLNILGAVATVPADKKPKQALTTSSAWYNGRICTVVKRLTENIDGLTLKLCVIRFDDGSSATVPADHLTVL